MQHFLVFGSHPRLSLAEFRNVQPQVNSPLLIGNATLVEAQTWDEKRLMQQLGGTVKLGDIRAALPTSQLNGPRLVEILAPSSTKPLSFGLTIFGSKKFSKLPIEFKRCLKSQGIASRWVTGKGGTEIAPAAVEKLKLVTEGVDLCLFMRGETAYVGVTTQVQNADAWSLRDYGRPARDEVAGMLPPKLARMMVNLAAAQLSTKQKLGTLLDPFCGSGTIVMEAALATNATRIIGSDLEAKQISATHKNIIWLIKKGILLAKDEKRMETFVSDARELRRHFNSARIDCVVTEGTLGPPLRGHESRTALERTAREITNLWIATLKELHPLLAPHSRLVCIWPAFKTQIGSARVEFEKDLLALGYALINPFEGWDIPTGPLLYYRPGQKVMRRIVLLKPI